MSDIEVEPSVDMQIAEQRAKEETPLDAARKLAIKEKAIKALEEVDNPQNEAIEQAGDTDSHGKVRSARRLLEKEKKLREAREQFEKEQATIKEEFESSKAEWQDKIAAFETAAEEARYNPVEYLQSLGLSKEELLDTARVIMFQETPELATDAVKQKIQEIKYRQELKRLEDKFEKKEEEKKQPNTGALVEYQNGLIKAAQEVSSEAFPLTAQYMKNGADHMEIANAMYAAATQYAQETNGQGAPLSAEKCLERVEAKLKQLQLVSKQPEQSVEQEQEKKSPVIRNKVVKPVSNVDESKLTYEEQRELARQRARAVMRDRGLFE